MRSQGRRPGSRWGKKCGRDARAPSGTSMLLIGIRWLVLLAAAVPLVYYLAAIVCAFLFFRKRNGELPDFCPPVSVLKPMRGLNRETYQNLASLCRQQYPEYELLFCADDPQDLAIPVIRRLAVDFPQIPIRLSIGPSIPGSHNKVTKLCRLTDEARYDLLVASDVDIRVEPDYLRRVVAPFRDARTGAA